MARHPQGMHAEDIKAALRKTGGSIVMLSERWGYHRSAITIALRHQWPAVEAKIAKELGKQPKDIWPDRYHSNGTPKSRRTKADRSSVATGRNIECRDAA